MLVMFATPAADLERANAQAQGQVAIKLVLQITVDGLRGDLLNRYQAGLGEGGFKRLMQHGVYFTNAHYQYANTETIVGHTTLATGTFPSQHGMIGNVWFDREAGELAYNIEDPDSPILPMRDNESKGDENASNVLSFGQPEVLWRGKHAHLEERTGIQP